MDNVVLGEDTFYIHPGKKHTRVMTTHSRW